MKKKGVMNQIISIFILILVISVLSGMTFLFVTALKTQTRDDVEQTSVTVRNETGGYINSTGYLVANAGALNFANFVVIAADNASEDAEDHSIPLTNITYTASGYVYNVTEDWLAANISYTHTYLAGEDATAYLAMNATEAAGFNVTKYLSLLFLALIFGVVLVVVLRVILPYINMGKQMGSGF